ncbi:hypothetical protein ACFFYR_15925 [Paraburkholderia dipogonis]
MQIAAAKNRQVHCGKAFKECSERVVTQAGIAPAV